jgi:hypothetical protein
MSKSAGSSSDMIQGISAVHCWAEFLDCCTASLLVAEFSPRADAPRVLHKIENTKYDMLQNFESTFFVLDFEVTSTRANVSKYFDTRPSNSVKRAKDLPSTFSVGVKRDSIGEGGSLSDKERVRLKGEEIQDNLLAEERKGSMGLSHELIVLSPFPPLHYGQRNKLKTPLNPHQQYITHLYSLEQALTK